jgi:histidine ammonia-lyase
VFSRSTEGHNQDKVSMGLLAVQDLQRIIELTETVGAIHAIACAQAIELRGLSRPKKSQPKPTAPIEKPSRSGHEREGTCWNA